MARRRGRSRRGRRTGAAAIPLIPTLVAASPEILVGAKAAQEAALGVDAGTLGENALGRLAQLYGGPIKDPNTMGLKENVTMKVIGAVSHIIMRKAGLRVRLSKRLTLF